ncbi:MAG: glycerol-3-phosphate acyltransferase [Geitlerinemataceae cyanobacterium]
MSLAQVGGVLLIFLLCPLLGALPLTQWLTVAIAGIDLRRVGTGNVSVSAAFYHGGRPAGVAAVVSEALKSFAVVYFARLFFPAQSVWELVAVVGLVLGRYWSSRGAGVTNVVWAILAHDPIVAILAAAICGVGFTIVRERQAGKLFSLVVLPAVILMMYPTQLDRVGAAAALSGLLYWIYQKIPDDLDLEAEEAQPDAKRVFRFFQADRAVTTLDDTLEADRVGDKVARFSQLRHWGYAVPKGWVWEAGDDPELVAAAVAPGAEVKAIVRSSPIGELTVPLAAREPYGCVANIDDRDVLVLAIEECWTVYDRPEAVAYRRDRGLENRGMAVLVQRQIDGIFSGTACRLGARAEAVAGEDTADGGDVAIAIEAWLGTALRRQAERFSAERYRVSIASDIEPQTVLAIPPHADRFARSQPDSLPDAQLPAWIAELSLTPLPRDDGRPSDEIPAWLLREVAAIVWQLEVRLERPPVAIDWSYDGERLWLL